MIKRMIGANRSSRMNCLSADKAKHLYLLSGLIYCGECGYAMHGNARKPSPTRDELITYRCAHRTSKAACCNRKMKQEEIEGFVLDQLEKYFFNDAIIPKLTWELNTYLQSSLTESHARSERLSFQQKELEKQKQNIIDAITKTGYQDIFNEQLVKIEQQSQEVGRELAGIQKHLGSMTTITEDMLRAYIGQFRQFIQDRDLPQIKTFIQSYVKRVEVFAQHIRVTFQVALSFCSERYAEQSYQFSVETSRRKLKYTKLL